MNNELYIPLGLKSDKDFIPGFGFKEGILMAGCLALALIVSSLLWIILNSTTITIFTGLAIGSTGLLLFRRNENTNQSFFDLIGHMISFYKGVKVFKYVRLNELE